MVVSYVFSLPDGHAKAYRVYYSTYAETTSYLSKNPRGLPRTTIVLEQTLSHNPVISKPYAYIVKFKNKIGRENRRNL